MLSFWYRWWRLCMIAASWSSANMDMSCTPSMLLWSIGDTFSLFTSACCRYTTWKTERQSGLNKKKTELSHSQNADIHTDAWEVHQKRGENPAWAILRECLQLNNTLVRQQGFRISVPQSFSVLRPFFTLYTQQALPDKNNRHFAKQSTVWPI